MTNIINDIKKMKTGAAAVAEGADLFQNVSSSLFGNKPYLDDIAEEPIDTEFEDREEYDLHDDYPHETDRSKYRGLGLTEGFNTRPSIPMSKERTRAMAKMKKAELFLSNDFKIQPVKILVAMAFDKLGDPETANEIRNIEINSEEEENNFANLIEDIIYYEMLEDQENGTFKVPPHTEMMNYRLKEMAYRMAGPGFKNVTKLGTLGFDKIKNLGVFKK